MMAMVTLMILTLLVIINDDDDDYVRGDSIDNYGGSCK